MKRKLSPGGGRTIYNKFPKARQKASVEALKEGGMKKDRLASGYKARRKDPRSLVKAGVEAFKKKRVKKMGGGMMGRRMGYSEGKLAVTPREKQLAAQYGDKKRITRGDVITAAKKKSKSPMDKAVRKA